MSYTPTEREYRTFYALGNAAGLAAPNAKRDDVTQNIAQEESPTPTLTLRGTPILFNTPTILCEIDGVAYREIIARGALDECDLSDFILNRNHGQNDATIYARTRNHSLDYTITERGLSIAAHLDGEDERHRNLYRDVVKGLVDKMSFSFIVQDCTYDKDTHTRTITKIKKLFDVSAVDFPAYNETSLTAARAYLETMDDFPEMDSSRVRAAERRRRILIAKTYL